jgi:hypothetical protein
MYLQQQVHQPKGDYHYHQIAEQEPVVTAMCLQQQEHQLQKDHHY